MKRLSVLLMLLVGIAFHSFSYTYVTKCGIEVATVGIDYFEGDKVEFQNYLKELDEIFCDQDMGGEQPENPDEPKP